ncbi:MAG: hypothetical protein LIP01_05495 [Tannerellaceae bacterium]|nr:hypothetical protein [Tannerellaceae bacterium]
MYTQASWRALPIIKSINNVVCIKVRNTNGEGREKIILGSSGAAPASAPSPSTKEGGENTGGTESETTGTGDIDLTQNAQTVIKAVKGCEDVDVLKAALEEELAKEAPRKTVTEAIEDRIEVLEGDGE